MTVHWKKFKWFRKFKEFVEDATFQGSRGWFEKLKNKFNLRNMKLKVKAANTDDIASDECPYMLKGIIQRGGYEPEKVLPSVVFNRTVIEANA